MAQEPFTQLSDGRLVIEFHDYRFALAPERRPGPYGQPYVVLCIPELKDPQRSWRMPVDIWDLPKIVADISGFRAALARAVSISTNQPMLSTILPEEASDRPPGPALVNNASMQLQIDFSKPGDACYNDNDAVREARIAAGAGGEPPIWRKFAIGPLAGYIANEAIFAPAGGTIATEERGFPASRPLYVWCVYNGCRRYSKDDSGVVKTRFNFQEGRERYPEQWAPLDKYFHNYTRWIFLGSVPKGVE